MTFIIGALKIIIVLGTLITIHELGHFSIAKAFNVKVHRFAIGFGPKIFTKNSTETEYTLRLIPFGGFVQLEGEDKRSEDERAFNKKKVWQRISIISAGALVNIIFALLIYFCISSIGNTFVTSQVIGVAEGTKAYDIGIRENDNILKVNNRNTITKTHVVEAIENSKTDDIIFEVERNGEKIIIETAIKPETIGIIGVGFSDENEIVYIQKNSAAEISGLLLQDQVIKIKGELVEDVIELIETIRLNPNKILNFTIERDGKEMNIEIVPKAETARRLDTNYKIINPGFWGGLKYSIDETGYYFNETIKGIARIFTGNTENVEFMGPVGIAKEITKTEEYAQFFYLMSAISLSLGIFNLLPIPALDGGKILLLLIEGVRRKPIKEKTEIGLQLVGFAIIIMLSIVVTLSDIIKIF